MSDVSKTMNVNKDNVITDVMPRIYVVSLSKAINIIQH